MRSPERPPGGGRQPNTSTWHDNYFPILHESPRPRRRRSERPPSAVPTSASCMAVERHCLSGGPLRRGVSTWQSAPDLAAAVRTQRAAFAMLRHSDAGPSWSQSPAVRQVLVGLAILRTCDPPTSHWMHNFRSWACQHTRRSESTNSGREKVRFALPGLTVDRQYQREPAPDQEVGPQDRVSFETIRPGYQEPI